MSYASLGWAGLHLVLFDYVRLAWIVRVVIMDSSRSKVVAQ